MANLYWSTLFTEQIKPPNNFINVFISKRQQVTIKNLDWIRNFKYDAKDFAIWTDSYLIDHSDSVLYDGSFILGEHKFPLF